MTREVTDLLPCPFCGSGARIQDDDDERMFYVACTGADCFCAVGEGYDRSAMPDHSFFDRDTAIAAWNKRAPDRGDSPTIPIYRTSPAPNDNSKAIGGFTRVLEDKGMLDKDGMVKSERDD